MLGSNGMTCDTAFVYPRGCMHGVGYRVCPGGKSPFVLELVLVCRMVRVLCLVVRAPLVLSASAIFSYF